MLKNERQLFLVSVFAMMWNKDLVRKSLINGYRNDATSSVIGLQIVLFLRLDEVISIYVLFFVTFNFLLEQNLNGGSHLRKCFTTNCLKWRYKTRILFLE